MRRWIEIIAAIAVVAASGCTTTTEPAAGLNVAVSASSPSDVDWALASDRTGPPNADVAGTPLIAGYSVEGRPIVYYVVGDGAGVVLIMASIHGNEGAGTPLVDRLHEALRAEPPPADRTVVLVPVANPDGVARGKRRNANGRDLNRDFPATNRRGGRKAGPFEAAPTEPGLEPETRAVIDLIERYRPSAIVSIHQPLACIDYDGPAKAFARSMASEGSLAVRKLGARPGSLGSWAGVDQGIPVITLELSRSASRLSDDELWDRYGAMLLLAIDAVLFQSSSDAPTGSSPSQGSYGDTAIRSSNHSSATRSRDRRYGAGGPEPDRRLHRFPAGEAVPDPRSRPALHEGLRRDPGLGRRAVSSAAGEEPESERLRRTVRPLGQVRMSEPACAPRRAPSSASDRGVRGTLSP